MFITTQEKKWVYVVNDDLVLVRKITKILDKKSLRNVNFLFFFPVNRTKRKFVIFKKRVT